MTTWHHFRRWLGVNGALYLTGYLRPAEDHKKTKTELHPQIAT
jgi:hypothetical protein